MIKYILEAKNISKSFGNVKALEDVNFYLQKGKIHGLLGENGAGIIINEYTFGNLSA